MRQMAALAMAVGIAVLSTGPADADFVLGTAQPEIVPAVQIPAAALPAATSQDTPRQAVPLFKLARGFGNAVPMAFAVRQIVPAGVKVRYGAGIDPEVPVSWRGGRPWNQALAEAVRPLHLRIVTRTDTVLITR